MSDYIPKWHKELEIFTKIKPLIILEGNVLDSFQYPEEGSTPKGSIVRLSEYLHYFFKDNGYQNIVFYDSMQGFYNNCESGYLDNFAKLINATPNHGYIPAEFRGSRENTASSITRQVLSQNKEASVIIMNFASRYISTPDNMTQAEVDSYTALIQASMEANNVRTGEYGVLKNLLLMITNKANDIPAWFYLQNPNVKMITVSAPDKQEREAFVKGRNFPLFFCRRNLIKDRTASNIISKGFILKIFHKLKQLLHSLKRNNLISLQRRLFQLSNHFLLITILLHLINQITNAHIIKINLISII